MSEPVVCRKLSRKSSTGRAATSRLQSATTELDDGDFPGLASISEKPDGVHRGFSAVVLDRGDPLELATSAVFEPTSFPKPLKAALKLHA